LIAASFLKRSASFLRRSGHVAEQCSDGRENRCHDGDAARERIATVGCVLDFVIVRTVNVKMAF
jgi:hypothetical protein